MSPQNSTRHIDRNQRLLESEQAVPVAATPLW
jgi:hypothetical protein